jgi:hypothetical protein
MSDQDSDIAQAQLDGRSRAARALKAQEGDGQAVPQGRRRRRVSAGGFALKLDAPPRAGFVRRFVNGDPARLLKMEELGYTLVNDPAGQDSARTDELGSRIARHAGKTEEGQPFKAYLMETPVSEYEFGVQDKEDARKPFEEAIRRSADTTGQVENAYQPGQSTIRHSG